MNFPRQSFECFHTVLTWYFPALPRSLSLALPGCQRLKGFLVAIKERDREEALANW